MIRAAADFSMIARALAARAAALAKARVEARRVGSVAAWRDPRLLWPLSTKE